MPIPARPNSPVPTAFVIQIVAIAFVTLLTRFWQLDGLSPTVFDEVYYPKFAQNYLQGVPFFDAHPPLGKYIIAWGIQLFGYNPFGYRAFNALAGSLVPAIAGALAYELSGSRRWALLSAWFVSLDGLLLVESRYGLINIYLVLFGMLSQLCLAIALRRQRGSWFWLGAAGGMLGAAVSVKWSGLTYLVGLAAIGLVFWWRDRRHFAPTVLVWGLLVLPLLVYVGIWIPHLLVNPERNLLALHREILGFHQNLGKDAAAPIHPYCSSWWSWPWLLRPIAYFYEAKPDGTIFFVNAMGNPFLYWLSAIALLLCILLLQNRLWNWAEQQVRQLDGALPSVPFLPLYLAASFGGHYLPWMFVRRCTFLYLYMPASVMGFMAIALAVDWCSRQELDKLQWLAVGIAIAIGLSFAFWLPVYLGLPISATYFRWLMWFPGWI